ncbi:hypothetical protein EV702DRAFT_1043899 [Suillus placidus]|uniref:Uncharacterized protein n=1 Tax=Suillus placidus TaxID=48579 RepID=A0A9P6ZZA8_9AGAM|nr:hypothetical protein EV702DRAFT_1043899 [Suillus placidus]
MLQHPHRQRQLPLRFRNNNPAHTGTSRTAGDGEYIEIGNVSGDEEDNLPAPGVRAPPVLGPLQTATSTVYSTQTDPLATGILGTQPKSMADIHYFFRLDLATNHKTCQACEGLQKADSSHPIASYKHTTGTSAHHNHAFYSHTNLYLQEAKCLCWPILVKSLKGQLNEGWTLAAIRERLQDSAYHIDSLGSIPNQAHSLPGTGLSLDDYLQDFGIDEMHHQLVKFIVANDQESGVYFLCVLLN